MESFANSTKISTVVTFRNIITSVMPVYVLLLLVFSMIGGQPSQANAAEKCTHKILNEICLGGSLKKYASQTSLTVYKEDDTPPNVTISGFTIELWRILDKDKFEQFGRTSLGMLANKHGIIDVKLWAWKDKLYQVYLKFSGRKTTAFGYYIGLEGVYGPPGNIDGRGTNVPSYVWNSSKGYTVAMHEFHDESAENIVFHVWYTIDGIAKRAAQDGGY